MQAHEKQNPAVGPGFAGSQTSRHRLLAEHASADVLLQRLEGVQKTGAGWRARCPACGGRSRKVSIAEAAGRVLVHCFGGCSGVAVIGAVGLTWADLYPPRHWPQSPEERRQARRAVREAGWAAALSTLALEAAIVQLAANQVVRGEPMDWNDYIRLVEAEERISNARNALTEVTGLRHRGRA